MRILSVGNFGRGWDGSICDEEHIAKALEDLGHEVKRMQREDMNLVSRGDYDFTLIAQWDKYNSSIVSLLPKPLVYWAFDYQADGQEWHEQLIQQADLYLSKRIADSKYRNWQWLSHDFAPEFLDKYPWNNPSIIRPLLDIDVLFTGSYLPWATERNETIKAVNKKFNLVVHSVNSWPEEWGLDVRPPIMDEGLPELYSRAKVILSIDHTIEAGYWSDRSAQIMACGRMPLFRYVPLSEVRFGQKVHYFWNVESCFDGIQDLLAREEDSALYDRSAYDYAHSHLMVKNRVKDLLLIVEGIL